MSKRRVSKQQSNRIVKKQNSYLISPEDYNNASEGLVIARFGSHALVEDNQGHRIHCSIRPSIDSLVAGDRIVWLEESENQGVIVGRHERQSALGRPDKKGALKVVAANISQMMIVLAVKPQVSWPLLDSYLIIAHSLNIHPVIVLNKTDLPCQEIKNRLIEQYQSLNYELIFVHQNQDILHSNLARALQQHISVFVGQSGVGKSTLISRFVPEDTKIQTQAISSISKLGKHTTSHSTLYHLSTGGALIDSPGVREFGLWHMSLSEITQGYREFKPFLSDCKFRDCNHINTLGCALQNAIKNGLISHDRFDNYVKIRAQFAT